MLSQSAIRAAWEPRCTGPFVRVPLHGAGVVSVRPAAREAFEALSAVFEAYDYRTRREDTGAYNCRPTASGAWSLHAYAIAADSNWQANPYGTRTTDRPPGLNDAVVGVRTLNGKQVFNNGIFWRTPDPMHDEIVCSPRDLATGIDWSTVPGRGVPTPQPESEDFMARRFIRLRQQGHPHNGRLEVVGDFHRRHVSDADEAAAYERLGIVENVTPRQFNTMTSGRDVVQGRGGLRA